MQNLSHRRNETLLRSAASECGGYCCAFCWRRFTQRLIVSPQRRFIFSWRAMNKPQQRPHRNSVDSSISSPLSHGFIAVGWEVGCRIDSVIQSVDKLSTSHFLRLLISLKSNYYQKTTSNNVTLWTLCRYETRLSSFVEAIEGEGQ